MNKSNVSRFNACLALIENKIMVIGGWEFGENSEAILSNCEMFCLNSLKWI